MLTANYLPNINWQAAGVGAVDGAAAATLTSAPPNPNENLDTFVSTDPTTGKPMFNSAAWASAVSTERGVELGGVELGGVELGSVGQCGVGERGVEFGRVELGRQYGDVEPRHLHRGDVRTVGRVDKQQRWKQWRPRWPPLLVRALQE